MKSKITKYIEQNNVDYLTYDSIYNTNKNKNFLNNSLNISNNKLTIQSRS